MAIIAYGPIVDDAIGSIDAVTFANSLAGPAARARRGPQNFRTAAQLTARNNLATVSVTWGILTTTQQAQWRAAALTQPYLDRLGNVRTMSGKALFTRFNVRLLTQGKPLILTPPGAFTAPGINTAGILFVLTGSVTTGLTAFWNRDAGFGGDLLIEAGPPTPWGTLPQSQQYRVITTIAPGVLGPVPITGPYVAVYGILPTTTPYKIRVRLTPTNVATGVDSTPREYIGYVAGAAPAPPPTPGITAAAAPTITPGLQYSYVGDLVNPAFLALSTVAGLVYTVTWDQASAGNSPKLQFGTSPASLTTLTTFSQDDTSTFPALAGYTYYIAVPAWGSPNHWTVTYNPEQLPVTLTDDTGLVDLTPDNQFFLLGAS
jgi:hypothetical protein